MNSNGLVMQTLQELITAWMLCVVDHLHNLCLLLADVTRQDKHLVWLSTTWQACVHFAELASINTA